MEDLPPNFGTVIFTHRHPPLSNKNSRSPNLCFCSLSLQQGPTSRCASFPSIVVRHTQCSSGLVLGRLPVAPPPKIGARPSTTTNRLVSLVHSPLHSDCPTTQLKNASIFPSSVAHSHYVRSLRYTFTRSSQEIHRHFKPPPESVDNRFFVGPRSMSL